MDGWGCEFLDDGHFGLIPARDEPTLPSETILLPMHLVELMVNKHRVTEVKLKDATQIHSLMASISVIGLQVPVNVVYTPSSVYLADGHHRFVACQNLGFEHIPALVSSGSHKAKIGISSLRFIERIMDDFRI